MFCDTGVSSATFGNLHREMSTSANTSGMLFHKWINDHIKEKHQTVIMLCVILISLGQKNKIFEFFFGHRRACSGWLEEPKKQFSNFWQKCPFSSAKKWHFERSEPRTDPQNPAKHPPKWWGRHLDQAFPFSGEYQAKFWKLLNLGPPGALFPLS